MKRTLKSEYSNHDMTIPTVKTKQIPQNSISTWQNINQDSYYM